MAGYETRQSSYSDGDVIIAAHTNDEFDAIVAAMNAATGHAHDGTAGEGPVIALIGDAGSGSPLNRVQIDTVNDRIGFFIDDAGASVEQIRLTNGALLPVTDSDVDLGSNSVRFKNSFTDNLTVTSNITVGGTVDGRNVSVDGAKLDGIEAGADVTDFTNVQAAGALMDSELTNVAAVKAINQQLTTTSSPTFASLNTTGILTVDGNLASVNGASPRVHLIETDVANLNARMILDGGKLYFQQVNDAITVSSNILTIDLANNRVGINDTTPEYDLQVNGSLAESTGFYNFSGRIYFNSTGPTGDYIDQTTQTGITYYENGVANWRLPGADNSTFTGYIGAAEGSGAKFGIGTDTPERRLDVRDHTQNEVLQVVGNNGGTIVYGDSGDPIRWIAGLNTAGDFIIYDHNNAVTQVVVDAGTGDTSFYGNVVAGNGGAGPVALTTNDGSGNANLCFNHTDGAAQVGGSSARITSDVDAGTASLEFQLKDNVTAGAQTLTEYFGIRTSGVSVSGGANFTVDGNTLTVDSSSDRVGINTNSPGYALEVIDTTVPTGNILALRGNVSAWIVFGDNADNTRWRLGTGTTGNFALLDANASSVAVINVEPGAGADAIRVDSTGNVGLGFANPSYPLHVNGAIGSSGALYVLGRSIYFDTGGTSGDYLRHATTEGLYWYENGAEQGRLGTGTNQSRFFSDVQVGGLSEGNLGTGTEDGIFLDSVGQVNVSRNNANALALRRRTGLGTLALFRYNTNTVGSIEIDSTTTVAFNTSSDERLKENIVDAKPSGDVIDAIKVREFNWKDNGVKWDYGFVAQELNEAYPLAVSPAEDEDADPLQDPWQVDILRLIPVMMKELQELRKRVAELESSK